MAAPLRTRATLLATILMGLVLVAAAVALVLILQNRLIAGTDALSRQRVGDLLEQAERGELPATITNLDDEGVAQVVSDDGRVLAASANVEGAPPLSGPDPGEGGAVATVRAPDDDETETYRVWMDSTETPQGRVTVYVGNSLESVHEATGALRSALYAGVPTLLLLLALGTWLVLGGALGRVDRIRREVDTITDERLDRRVVEGSADDEVGRLAATMNRMLDRLQSARDRQLSLVADVSHDLQSPLASQRAQLEVARAQPASTDLDVLTSGLLVTTAEMEHLVRDLLVLAAADAGAPPPPASEIDLDDVVLEEAARVRAVVQLVIDTSGVSAAPASANRADVSRIVRNLLDNACAHAATTVTLIAGSGPDGTFLVVADDGPGVPAEARERIFDRFHRVDSSRSRHAQGSGLGLAIARTLAERNGGRLDLAADTSTGARFELRLSHSG